jgi:hypothetical protein
LPGRVTPLLCNAGNAVSNEPMTFVDGALLHLVEGLCHRFQRLTGRTSVWLAFQMTNLSIVIYFIWAVQWYLRGPRMIRPGLTVFFVLLIYGLTQSVLRTPIEAVEASAYNRVARGLRNPRRVRDLMLRVLFLALSVFLLGPFVLALVTFRIQIVLLGYSLIILTTVVLYLLAVDPLPPCESRIREWVRGSFRVLAPAPRGAGGGQSGEGGRAGMTRSHGASRRVAGPGSSASTEPARDDTVEG